MWRNNGERCFKTVISLGLASLLAACEATVAPDRPVFSLRPGEGGLIVADEPQSVLLTQDVLKSGGSAADAAVALGFSLAVTLQSRAGLGGGGVCLVYDADSRRAEVIDFGPVAATGNAMSARWQVGVPTLARGLFALHAKYGQLPWQQVVIPAENTVRFRNVVSRAFASDLANSSSVLINDPNALDTFMTSGRRMADEGSRLVQLDLAATIGRLRGRTPGDFYSGAFSRTVEESSQIAGASLSAEDLRAYAPRWRVATVTQVGNASIYTAPISKPERAGGSAEDPGASTGFVVADARGNTVSCALTMTKPFGNGLMPPGVGFLLSPSPEQAGLTAPDLAPVIAVDSDTQSILYAAASGGVGAQDRVMRATMAVLEGGQSTDEPLSDSEPANTAPPFFNSIHCPRGLQREIRACEVRADPAGFGFGLIATGEQ